MSDVQTTQTQAASPLSALAGQADQLTAEVSAANNPPPPGEAGQVAPAAPALSNADVLFGAFGTFRVAADMRLKLRSTKLLTDEALRALAEPWGKVLDAKGINLNEKMGGWPLLEAIATTVAVLLPFADSLKEELAERRAAAQGQGRPYVPPADGRIVTHADLDEVRGPNG